MTEKIFLKQHLRIFIGVGLIRCYRKSAFMIIMYSLWFSVLPFFIYKSSGGLFCRHWTSTTRFFVSFLCISRSLFCGEICLWCRISAFDSCVWLVLWFWHEICLCQREYIIWFGVNDIWRVFAKIHEQHSSGSFWKRINSIFEL